MARRIDSAVEIAASPATVWRILTDFSAYPEWNPFIRAIQGEARLGARLSVSIQPPGGRAMQFQPQVQEAQPQRVFSWLGRLLLPGLFDGRHEFRLEANAGGTRLLHGESFSGVLVPLAWNSMQQPTRAGFEAMNRALKARAEAPASEG